MTQRYKKLIRFLFPILFSMVFNLPISNECSTAIALTVQSESHTPFPIKDLTVPTLTLNHHNNFSKFDLKTGEKMKAGSRVLVPVAAGVALIFFSGPAGVLPIGVGLTLGAKSLVNSFKRSKAKKTLRGALLFLSGDDRSPDKEKRKLLEYFDAFYLSIEEEIRGYFWPDASTWQLKSFLASRILLINQFGFLIANRCRNESRYSGEQSLSQASPDGIFTTTFFQTNIYSLILILEDMLWLCSPEFLHRLSYGPSRPESH